MKAAERTLQQILHSPDQYVIPVFQRYYVWSTANWGQLWDDLQALLEGPEEKRRHFLGSIVCVPGPHLPGVVPAHQVIDGQQRLTTLSILLCAVRDAAGNLGWDQLAAEVEENYLIHRFKKGRERYKVFPRLGGTSLTFRPCESCRASPGLVHFARWLLLCRCTPAEATSHGGCRRTRSRPKQAFAP